MNKKILLALLLAVVILGATYYIVVRQNQSPTPAEVVDFEAVVVNYTGENGEVITVNYPDIDTAVLTGLGYDSLIFKIAISASGARYVNEDEDMVLWNKGDEVTVFRGDDTLFFGTATTDEARVTNFTFTADDGEQVDITFPDTDTAILNGLGYTNLPFTIAISASGARYVNEDEDMVLWNKGDEVTITKGDEDLFFGITKSANADESNSGLGAYTWVWEETEMNDDTIVKPETAGKFTLTFNEAEGTVGGTTDCNGFGGSYKVGEGKTIDFGDDFFMTQMYCEGSQENEFQNMVKDSTSFMFNDEGDLVLLLKYDSGSVVFSKQVLEVN